MFPGMPGMGPGFDPSKLDPKLISEITELMSTLPPAEIMKMQSLMHNAMAGFDVKKDMEEFEKNLPPGFREKMAGIMYRAYGVPADQTVGASSGTVAGPASANAPIPGSVAQARLTILEGVAQGRMSPNEALKVLFPDE